MKNILIPIVTFSCLFKIHAQHTYAFFGSFNRDKDTEGLYVYELDTLSGKLSKITSFTGILNPSFLTVSPNGKYVFACTESKTKNSGSVSSFEFNPEKKSLTFISKQKSGGENPVYLTVHQNGKWLVNGNYTEGSVSVYPVSENGQIQPYVQNFQFSEGSVNPDRQQRAHIHATVFSPDSNYLFLPDLGADKIRAYRFESENNQPLQPADIPLTPHCSGKRTKASHLSSQRKICLLH